MFFLKIYNVDKLKRNDIRSQLLTYHRILDISVPGHFGTDLDISVLGTRQFGTWMRQYSVLTTIVWYLLIVNIFVVVVVLYDPKVDRYVFHYQLCYVCSCE
jgi:hypothetical protein